MDVKQIKNLKNKIRMLRATLLIRNEKVSGKIYHVMYDTNIKHWAIKSDKKRNITRLKDKKIAVELAKKWAKKAYMGQVFIYKKSGAPQKAYTYVDEMRKKRKRICDSMCR